MAYFSKYKYSTKLSFQEIAKIAREIIPSLFSEEIARKKIKPSANSGPNTWEDDVKGFCESNNMAIDY